MLNLTVNILFYIGNKAIDFSIKLHLKYNTKVGKYINEFQQTVGNIEEAIKNNLNSKSENKPDPISSIFVIKGNKNGPSEN